MVRGAARVSAAVARHDAHVRVVAAEGIGRIGARFGAQWLEDVAAAVVPATG
jgi:hypothetical protein